ncbi:MAG: succinate dehydrogenase cytochrome b subunit [Planctomycetota bacterium]
MAALRRLLMSSIGKKYVMGLSGVLLMGFVVAHLAGNLLIFQGSEAYNDYAYKLHSLGPLLILAEVGLTGLFVLHVLYAYWLVAENKASRGKNYAIAHKSKQETSFLNLAPRSWMAISGSIVLAFLVWHLIDMRLGIRDRVDPTFGEYVDEAYTDADGDPLKLAYERSVQVLTTPASFVLYTLGSVLLGLHLSHGASSWFRSVGLETGGLGAILKKLGVAAAVAIGLGFASIPLYIWFGGVETGDVAAAAAREQARHSSESSADEPVVLRDEETDADATAAAALSAEPSDTASSIASRSAAADE